MILILYILFRFIYSLLPGANMKHFFGSLLLYRFKSSSEEKNTSDCSDEKVNTLLNGFFCTYVNSLRVYIGSFGLIDFDPFTNNHIYQSNPETPNPIIIIKYLIPGLETLLIAVFSADATSLWLTLKEENFIVKKKDFNKVSQRLK